MTRSFTAVWAALGCGLLGGAAMGQSAGGVNIDLNTITGGGGGQPSILFGGAAGQTGYWNAIGGPFATGSVFAVRNLANSANVATLQVINFAGAGTGTLTFNNPNTSGDEELLLDDVHSIGENTATTYYIGPFAGGVYDVYTYAVAPDSAAHRVAVTLVNPSALITTSVERIVEGGIPAGGGLAAGATHAVHRVAVARGESVVVNVRTIEGRASVNGFQVKPVTGYTRLYVRPGPLPGEPVMQTGLSWAEPCTELQRALSIAADNPGVTEIWIARGRHYANRVLYASSDTDATFSPRSNLTLRGGFNATESTPEQRTEGGVATQLDGDGDVKHVVTLNGVSNVLIERVNINNGANFLGMSSPGNGGAGVRVVNGSGTFERIRFGGNVAAGSGGVFNVSGASSNVTVSDFDTVGNEAFAGSFLTMTGGSVTLNRGRIGNNTSTNGSGGVLNVLGASSSLTMNNCLVANNQQTSWIIDASSGGGLQVFNCTFAHNRSTISTNVGITGPAASTIRNSIVYGNVSSIGAPTMPGVLRFASGFGGLTDNIVQQWDGTLTPASSLNFDADPRFTFPDPAGLLGEGEVLGAGQYQLGSRSPARDSGWDAAAPVGGDISGSARIVDDPLVANTGFNGGMVDRGCFEAQAPSVPCPGDMGGVGGLPGADGVRDNNDFVVFIDRFFSHHPAADVGRAGGVAPGDGVFDNNDFVVFIDMFFTPCL